jgi:hypothetical protein
MMAQGLAKASCSVLMHHADRDITDEFRYQSIYSKFGTVYRGADKSLDRPGRKQATATEDFDFHISYLSS